MNIFSLVSHTLRPCPPAVEELLREKAADVKVLRTGGQWYGVTYAEDKPQVMAALQRMRDEGIYPERFLLED